MEFEKSGSAPVQGKMRFTCENVWVEIRRKGQSRESRFGTPFGTWELSDTFLNRPEDELSWVYSLPFLSLELDNKSGTIASQVAKLPDDEDLNLLRQHRGIFTALTLMHRKRPYASAPVRSRPRRTYDPARRTPDPEGDYIPMYLAHLSHHDQNRWNELKEAIEDFGKESGLFDELDIRHLGKRDCEPFQVQVRKSGRRLKGPHRNLIDVGYGVSQVLPMITELLEEDAPPIFLLQQPKVHLNPSAQAALGSLFCQVASEERQLIIETHSDHLLDRVRMDVRDGKTNLKPDDVSILYFERNDLDVRIHFLKYDQEGNLLAITQAANPFLGWLISA